MHLFYRLSRRWPLILTTGAALGALALVWLAREAPWQPLPEVSVDALSAFFLFALFGGMALALAVGPREPRRVSWRALVALAALIVGLVTTLTPAIAGAYALAALLSYSYPRRNAKKHENRIHLRIAWRGFADQGRRALLAAPGLVAAGSLLAGYGALGLRGALRYTDRAAGGALDSFAFWFVLLAAVVASSRLYLPTTDDRRPTTDDRPTAADQRPTAADQPPPTTDQGEISLQPPASSLQPPASSLQLGHDIIRIAWLYPLVRLYSLGPWNNGWMFATVLLGGAAALWAAGSALIQADERARRARILLSYLGIALAGLGLGTSAGIAAGCYALLAYLVLVAVAAVPPAVGASAGRPANASLRWLLSGAVPLTAPFVAAWMLVGAGLASGLTLLSGVAWLVALLNGLTTALTTAPSPSVRRSLAWVAAASGLLGVGAPLVVRALIQPVVAQLQGGLTPYGDVDIWPWVGLAAFDSAHTRVAALPSIAVAGLMLVLSALVYLVARVRESAETPATGAPDERDTPEHPAEPLRRLGTIAAALRDEVPWLALGARVESGERPIDGE